MGRPVVHFEIGCRDTAKTQEFYAKLFDWKVSPMGPAAMIAPEGGGNWWTYQFAGTRTASLHNFLCGCG